MFNPYVIETEGRAKAQEILRVAEADQLYQQFKKGRPGLRQRIGALMLNAGQKLQPDCQSSSATFTSGTK